MRMTLKWHTFFNGLSEYRGGSLDLFRNFVGLWFDFIKDCHKFFPIKVVIASELCWFLEISPHCS